MTQECHVLLAHLLLGSAEPDHAITAKRGVFFDIHHVLGLLPLMVPALLHDHVLFCVLEHELVLVGAALRSKSLAGLRQNQRGVQSPMTFLPFLLLQLHPRLLAAVVAHGVRDLMARVIAALLAHAENRVLRIVMVLYRVVQLALLDCFGLRAESFFALGVVFNQFLLKIGLLLFMG